MVSSEPKIKKKMEIFKKNFTSFGSRMRFVREKLGLTQAALAVQLGFTSHKVISRFEQGQRVPNAEALLRLAALGDFNLHWLITGEPSPDGEAWRTAHAGLLLNYQEDAGEYLGQLNREIKDWQKKSNEIAEKDSRGEPINIGELERCKEEIAVRQSKVDRIRDHLKQAFDRSGGVRLEF